MRILYENNLLKTTVTGSAINPNFPLLNLFKEDTRYETRTMLTTEQRLVFTGADIAASWAVIINHNISKDAVVRFQGNNDNDWTNPGLDVEINHYKKVMAELFPETTYYNYYSLYIDDPENTDSYLKFGKIWFGLELDMPDMKPDITFKMKTTSKTKDSPSGTSYGRKGQPYWEVTANFPYVSSDEQKETEELFDVVDTSQPIIMIPWANEMDSKPPLHCRITGDISFKNTESLRYPYTFSMAFREIK